MTRAELEAVFERVRAIDPDLVAAVDDVDETLLDWTAALTQSERLRASTQAARAIQRLRGDAPDAG